MLVELFDFLRFLGQDFAPPEFDSLAILILVIPESWGQDLQFRAAQIHSTSDYSYTHHH
jgi:hypothetical protein